MGVAGVEEGTSRPSVFDIEAIMCTCLMLTIPLSIFKPH